MRVGDYVRIDGYISKIGHIRASSSGKVYIQWKQPNGLLASGNINVIEKSSPNIIDLIEVGDYVNGIRVDEIKNGQLRTSSYYDGYICNLCSENEIKTIVTKEQFSSMEYKVESEVK